MKRLHVFVMLIMACFWVLSGVVQAQGIGRHKAIGNLVWNDLNKNGVQDLGEPGLPDVWVYLYKCGDFRPGEVSTSSISNGATLVAKTRTDVNGNYAFGDLYPAKYYVAIDVPDGWALSPVFQGTSDEKDSDIFPYLDHSGFICIFESTSELLSVDAGLFQIQKFDLVTIGDMVFNDCNHNGIQDCEEVGIAGVRVRLYACDVIPLDGNDYLSLNRKHCKGYFVEETITDLNGHYEFGALLPGEYCIEVCLPHGFRTVPRPNCPDVCNPSYETNTTGCMMFNACTKNLDIDFAVCNKEDNCNLAAVGDLVWKDSDADGIQEMSESVMPGITLTLYASCPHDPVPGPFVTSDYCYDCEAMKIGTVKTDANGKYLFKNLIPGLYYIVVSTPLAYDVTPVTNYINPLEENNDNDFFGCDPTTVTSQGCGDDCKEINRTGTFWLSAGDPVLNVDAGLVFDPDEVASIGDRVWRDDDGDGIQDDREIGVPGVTIKLFECQETCQQNDAKIESEEYNYKHASCSGKLVATTTTDENGNYSFSMIPAGKKYCLKITVPSCYVLSPYHRGCYDENSDFYPKDASTRCIYACCGENIDWIDAGLVPVKADPGMVGDFVWNDANQNGIQDCDEKGICGVTVELHNADGGALVATETTDENGKYLFTNVTTNASYFVKFILKAGYAFTAQNVGNDDGLDSDPCPEKAITANFTLISGQPTMLVDAGMYQVSCTISNYVWNDENKNGVKDANEAGIANVKVELCSCGSGDAIQSVVTDETGLYTFSSVLPGKYNVKVTVPDGLVLANSEMSAMSTVGECFDVTLGGSETGVAVPLVSGVADASRTGIPTQFGLDQNFPNPFNPSTTIRFAIPEAGMYTLKVYNMLGQEVATLINGELSAGYKDVVFDASRLTSGVYIYRLTGNNVVMTKKMMLNK